MRAVQGDRNFWRVGRKIVAAIWDAHARIYHGYEVIGLENVPQEGPALIVYYHGAIPIDMYYLNSRMLLQRERFGFGGAEWGSFAAAALFALSSARTDRRQSHLLCNRRSESQLAAAPGPRLFGKLITKQIACDCNATSDLMSISASAGTTVCALAVLSMVPRHPAITDSTQSIQTNKRMFKFKLAVVF